jgi:hypothetical protein
MQKSQEKEVPGIMREMVFKASVFFPLHTPFFFSCLSCAP